MKRKSPLILASIAAALLLVVGAMAFVYQRGEAEKRAKLEADKARQEQLVRADSRTLGPATAKVTVVEFFDPECESCRAVYSDLKGLLQRYEGKMRLVLRYMPLHPNSVQAATALEAAGEQERYWELLTVMFERQPEWADHHAPKPELVRVLAGQIGIDLTKFDASVAKPEHRQKIDRDMADGQRLGVTGTPSFFVNGRLLTQLSLAGLQALIEEELAK